MQRVKHPETFYSLTEDFDLIVASFQEQYGIRLSRELKGMKWSEFVMLLKGINHKTPLGRIVSIRAETDKEIIKKFSPYEKEIYNEWSRKKAKDISEEKYSQIIEGLKKTLVSLAGGDNDK